MEELFVRGKSGSRLPCRDLAQFGYDYSFIQQWREEHDATRSPGILEFFAAHGLCADCSGRGVEIAGNVYAPPAEPMVWSSQGGSRSLPLR